MFVRRFCLLLGLLLISQISPGAERTIVLEVRDHGNTGANQSSVGGYARTISGFSLAYHSSHPDAKSALLVRAQQDQSGIWESDTLVRPAGDGFYHLVWLAGLAKGGLDTVTAHHFHLLANGKACVDFTNRKDSTAKDWTVGGTDGAELRFHADMEDRYGDLFGLMTLKLPRRFAERGKPVLLEVVGDNEGSADWYMTFQYGFKFVPQVRVEPALVKGTSAQQLLRVGMDNLQSKRMLTVTATDQAAIQTALKPGANIIWLSVAAADSPTVWTILIRKNGKEVRRERLEIKPVVQRDIYLLPYSHTDIGYTDQQSVVLRKHEQYIDDAQRLIERTRDYPEDARFKWNIEVLYPLELYLKWADVDRQKALFQAVANGSIGLNAFYANVLTGLMTSEELDRSLADAQALSVRHDVPITTAVISDIPGFTWGTVDALAHSGVRYFASATNPFDRIGSMLSTWGDKPFWWKSQSGRDSVLMWIPAASYATFHQGSLPRLGKEKVLELARNLDDEHYPYRIVQLPYTLGDNAGVDTLLPDFVRQWNETYASPRLILATHRQMFEAFDREYGKQLPTYAGDLTPYWEDGAMSSAAETIMNRKSVNRLIQAEALWKMLSSATFRDSLFAEAWHYALLYDEHTWGAANSISQADDSSVIKQWETKQFFASVPFSQSMDLIQRTNRHSIAYEPDYCGFDIFNTTTHPRTDLVMLDLGPHKRSLDMDDRFPHGKSIEYIARDERGHLLRSQRLSNDKLAVLIENVPALGRKHIQIKPGKPLRGTSAIATGKTLSNEFLSLEVDRQSGAITHLVSKVTGHDFADSLSGLDQFLYVSGTDMTKAEPLRDVKVQMVENGNLMALIRVDGKTASGELVGYEIGVASGLNRVQLHYRIYKKPVRTKESVHIAFPFAVPDGQIRYDVAGAIVRPEKDQLPGSCKNFFSVNSWVDVSANDYGITLATPNIPLAEFGEMTAEQPWRQTVAPGTAVYSYVLNNYWHTNFKADQDGMIDFYYSLVPHGAFKADDADFIGQDQREPLIVLPGWKERR